MHDCLEQLPRLRVEELCELIAAGEKYLPRRMWADGRVVGDDRHPVIVRVATTVFLPLCISQPLLEQQTAVVGVECLQNLSHLEKILGLEIGARKYLVIQPTPRRQLDVR